MSLIFNLFTITLAICANILQIHGVNLLAGIVDRSLIAPEDAIFNLHTQINLSGPDIALAKVYVYLTGAVYCNPLPPWNCSLCQTSKALGYEYSAEVGDPLSETHALFTINKDKKEIVLAFRGTHTATNAFQDISLIMVPLEEGTADTVAKLNSSVIMVHVGFLKATKAIYPQVITKLNDLLLDNNGYSVVLAGHSLGEAIASLTLYMIQKKTDLPPNFPETVTYSLYGYGGPRVGNKAFADYWNKQSIQMSRIVNMKDSVPHLLPITLGYVHHGNEVWINEQGEERICSKDVYEDPQCSVSIQELERNLKHHVKYWNVNYLAYCKNPMTFASPKLYS